MAEFPTSLKPEMACAINLDTIKQESFAMNDTVNTLNKPRGRPFEKGTSGNPAGKPRGSRNVATRAAESLLDGESEALTRKAIEMALAGDISALRLCFDRILPPRRQRPLQFDMPTLETNDDAMEGIARISEGVAAGELSESEAKVLTDLVSNFTKLLSHTKKEGRASAYRRAFDVDL